MLTIVDDPIDTWRFANFGANANTPSIAGDTANPAGDGIANLMKYALGINPLIPTRTGLPTFAPTSGYDTLTFSRPTSATDITYIVEVSGGLLGAWATGSSYSISGDVPSNANTTQVSRTTNGSIETIVVRDNYAAELRHPAFHPAPRSSTLVTLKKVPANHSNGSNQNTLIRVICVIRRSNLLSRACHGLCRW